MTTHTPPYAFVRDGTLFLRGSILPTPDPTRLHLPTEGRPAYTSMGITHIAVTKIDVRLSPDGDRWAVHSVSAQGDCLREDGTPTGGGGLDHWQSDREIPHVVADLVLDYLRQNMDRLPWQFLDHTS